MTEEILELYELKYSDLQLLASSDRRSTSSDEMIQRLELASDAIIQNLGPSGPGLISISGVPKAQDLRQTLLPMARKLALLRNDDRKCVLKEHNLGSDVPLKNLDRVVSSFATQMTYGQNFAITSKANNDLSRDVSNGEFNDLGSAFRELGHCLMDIGLHFARACDKVIGGSELETSLLQSGTAKGRLIHYHSVLDNVLIKEAEKQKGKKANTRFDVRVSEDYGEADLWQQWHYDYGIFTILASPMFMMSSKGCNSEECEQLSGHTCLQIFCPDKNRVFKVRASKESFIVQVGESADVLSKGKLRATLHSVCRQPKIDNLSRETFVVFLQPAWNKTLSLSDYPIERLTLARERSETSDERSSGLNRRISEIVPPLSSRLRDGITFAEFSSETTRQYYGGSGLQSKR